MMRTRPFLVTLALCTWIDACATSGKDIDSESHFQCHVDADCRYAGARSVCRAGACTVPFGPGNDENAAGATGASESDAGAGGATGSAGNRGASSGGETSSVGCTDDPFDDRASFETTLGLLPLATGWTPNPPGIRAVAMSRNGAAIAAVSMTHASPERPFMLGPWMLWTTSGMVNLGPEEGTHVGPAAVSCDGSVIIGGDSDAHETVALRWTLPGGLQTLPPVSGDQVGAGWYRALAMNADGSRIWGLHELEDRSRTTIVSWSNELNATPSLTLEVGLVLQGIADDGSVLTRTRTPLTDSFLYRPSGFRGHLKNDDFSSVVAWALSPDGRLIGGAASGRDDEALAGFVWKETNGFTLLPGPGVVRGLNSRGIAVVVHESDYLVWDRAHGARRLEPLLATHGVVIPEGTQLIDIEAMSESGRVFAGTCWIADDPGIVHAYRAVLPRGVFD